jgi:hypothetical protein
MDANEVLVPGLIADNSGGMFSVDGDAPLAKSGCDVSRVAPAETPTMAKSRLDIALGSGCCMG